jgi:phage terminase large subunit
MSVRISIPNGFEPRPYQRAAMAYFDNGGTRAVTVWHRRAGKDLTAMHQACKAMHQEKGLYWHIFPTAEMARKMIWTGFTRAGDRIMEQVFPKATRKSPREWSPQGEMVVELKCGSVWRMIGSDRADTVGAGPKGVVLSEYALARPTAWDLIRPMLRESGGWAWFITTPRGNNHARKLYEQAGAGGSGWFRDLRTVHDTGLTYASNRRPGEQVGPDEMISEELAEGMPQELVDQEYRCSWSAANVGSFYGVLLAALEARGALGVEAPRDVGGDGVFTFWDLGRADDTAIWWLRLREGSTSERPRVDVLSHYASHGENLSHYFGVVEERARQSGWKYVRHVFPHDARAKTLASELSVIEQAARRLGAGMVEIGPELSLKDGIAAVRWLLQQEVRFFAACSALASPKDCDGVDALRSYRRLWDEERKCFREEPVHDWASHTADAFRYAALFIKRAEYLTRGLRLQPFAVPKQLTYGEVFEELE